jgi:hypothetical protein
MTDLDSTRHILGSGAINLTIVAKVDFAQLLAVIRCSPAMMGATATLSLDCGAFACGNANDVLAVAKELVRQERAVAIDLDWSKSPW